MGIYSVFELEVFDQDGPVHDKQIIEAFRESCESANDALGEEGESSDHSLEWYNCESDLSVFSRSQPGFTFVLTRIYLEFDMFPEKIYALNGRTEIIGPKSKCDRPHWLNA